MPVSVSPARSRSHVRHAAGPSAVIGSSRACHRLFGTPAGTVSAGRGDHRGRPRDRRGRRRCARGARLAAHADRQLPRRPCPGLRARRAARSCRKSPRRTGGTPVIADVRDSDALEAACAEAAARCGGLDAAVAVAGTIAGGPPVWEMPDAQWDAMLDVNLTGVFHLARAAVPHLLHQPGRPVRRHLFGRRHRAAAPLGGYVAAKHGVVGLVRTLAADLAGTTSPRTSSLQAPPTPRSSMPRPPSTGWRTPRNSPSTPTSAGCWTRRGGRVVGVSLLGASSAITGAVVPVDGGFTG